MRCLLSCKSDLIKLRCWGRKDIWWAPLTTKIPNHSSSRIDGGSTQGEVLTCYPIAITYYRRRCPFAKSLSCLRTRCTAPGYTFYSSRKTTKPQVRKDTYCPQDTPTIQLPSPARDRSENWKGVRLDTRDHVARSDLQYAKGRCFMGGWGLEI